MDTLCIEITTKCPLRCVHCSASASPEGRAWLSPDALRSQLTAAAPLAEVYLSGGEPFEHPDIFRMIELTRDAARVVVMYSSGVNTGGSGVEPLSEAALRQAKAAGLHRLDLSLYAADAARHEQVTLTPGSFEATCVTAQRASRVGLPFGVHFVPVADNGRELTKVGHLAQTLGAARLHVLALTRQGRALHTSDELAWPFLDALTRLVESRVPYDLVLSSALRRALRLGSTPRDALEARFMDPGGRLHFGEGARGRLLPLIPSG